MKNTDAYIHCTLNVHEQQLSVFTDTTNTLIKILICTFFIVPKASGKLYFDVFIYTWIISGKFEDTYILNLLVTIMLVSILGPS